jgi:hypothetical protein
VGIRNRLGIPGIISIIALVFAMTGGAYAAKKYVITSTSQIKPNVLKSLQGKDGAPGPTGAAGLPGAAGSKGDNGTAGSSGANGKSVVVGEELKGSAKCKEGGINVEVEGSGTQKFVCNGVTGFTATLPSGKTETGGFAVTGTEAESLGVYAPISFAIPLAAPILHENTHYVGAPNANCTGTVVEPTAAKGHLCIYESSSRLGPPTVAGLDGGSDANKTGAIIAFGPPEEGGEAVPTGVAYGSWAVTAP